MKVCDSSYGGNNNGDNKNDENNENNKNFTTMVTIKMVTTTIVTTMVSFNVTGEEGAKEPIPDKDVDLHLEGFHN